MASLLHAKQPPASSAAQGKHLLPQRRLLLDVVVCEGAPVLELRARKDEPLTVGLDALPVLDLALHHVDGVARLHIKGDGLARQRTEINKDLHCSSAQIGNVLQLFTVINFT